MLRIVVFVVVVRFFVFIIVMYIYEIGRIDVELYGVVDIVLMLFFVCV